MNYDLAHALEILERTPRVLRTWLDGLSIEWTHADYGEGTFTPFDVIGHLIHGERTDWIVRARIILEHGPARPFDAYDRYAQFEESRGKALSQLLDEFERLRTENIAVLRAISPTAEQLAARGTHPRLGSVTLENLLATWVAHDLNHIAQIAKCMATQYGEAVGPWRQYLTILQTPVTVMDGDGQRRAKAARGE